MTTKLDTYLAKLPNPAARAYANTYLRWLKGDRHRPYPDPRPDSLPFSSAQAVRASLEAYLFQLPEPKDEIK